MEQTNLKGKRIAMLVTDGFEQVEMTEPRAALERAGAKVDLISPKDDRVRGWKSTEWGDEFRVDVKLEDAKAGDYDAIVLPGGVMNPDKLRVLPSAQALVRGFAEASKPIAAICHGPWTLIDAGVAKGKKLTSWPTLRTDLTNAGAEWTDKDVIVDGNLVTSRMPGDIPAFNRETIALVAQAGRTADQDGKARGKSAHAGAPPPR
ncbi:MAG TPA: type 1 glutamine amidotransferase domain-containing protein [Polyangiaceae bacterium]|jgi:protease I